uniref:Envelope glycoprotein n=1 Tax=Pygocentrus nattereri TaxID=42514 RepID=A0AAR2JVE9_PYGNA
MIILCMVGIFMLFYHCISRYGGIELDYTLGSSTAWTFDLCDNCAAQNSTYSGYDVYLCWDLQVTTKCGFGWSWDDGWCKYWHSVIKYMGRWQPTLAARDAYTHKTDWEDMSFQGDFSRTQNPLTLSINWEKSIMGGTGRSPYLILGVDVSGKDPLGLIKINMRNKTTLATQEVSDPGLKGSDYTKWSPVDIVKLTTGYVGDNLWLKWLAAQAGEAGMEDCVACAHARAPLSLAPAPLFPDTDTTGFKCMIEFTKQANPINCTTLADIFPVIVNMMGTGPFRAPLSGNFTCFNCTYVDGTGRGKMINPDWCHITYSGSASVGPWARAGMPTHTFSLCAMVMLVSPILLVGQRQANQISIHRRKRETTEDHFDLTKNSLTYKDAIGVPRGVPDEYKLVNQIAAGFENIPIISALFPVTPNKNVDRINYVNYQVMHLANLTKVAVEGLSIQLSATSLMTIQNRMALDMLLEEKRGVCHMFGDMCCTFIPNNTAPDGSVTKALEGLKALSKEMHDNSGVDNIITGWLDKVFGKWKAVFISLWTLIAVFLAILITCDCCCVPCIRMLAERFIISMFHKQEPKGAIMMPLLGKGHDSEDEGNDDDQMIRQQILRLTWGHSIRVRIDLSGERSKGGIVDFYICSSILLSINIFSSILLSINIRRH